MTNEVVLAVHELGFGGASSAIMDQIALFHAAGYRVTVATFAPGPRTFDRVAQARSAGELPVGVDIRNLHEEWRNRTRTLRWDRRLRTAAGDAKRRVTRLGTRPREVMRGSTRTVEHARRGRLLCTDVYDVHGRVSVREWQTTGRGAVHDFLWSDGHVYLRQWLGSDGSVERETYFDPRGAAYLRRGVNPDGSSRGMELIDAASGSSRPGGLVAWQTGWLQSIVDACHGVPVVIGESQGIIARVAGLRRSSAVRVGMFHNSHLRPPYHEAAGVRAAHARAFAMSDELERIVAVSAAQADDIAQRVARPERVVTIPNPVVPEVLPEIERDEKLVSVVTRLVPLKGVPEAVAAFARVVAAVPDARMEIYGRGIDRHRVEAAIVDHHLSDRVRLMGRTDEPRAAMARALVTVSTSHTETMGLSIAESALQGTPAVAYDCRFGPAELIEDGITGRLVPVGDIDALADALIGLLRSPETAREMGARAQARLSEELSPARALARWQELFAAARAEIA